MKRSLLQKLRALAATEAKATKGPWVPHPGNRLIVADTQFHYVACCDDGLAISKKEQQENAAFIADSRNLLPALIKLVEAQHAALENLTKRFDAEIRSLTDSGYIGDNFPEYGKARAALALANEDQP